MHSWPPNHFLLGGEGAGQAHSAPPSIARHLSPVLWPLLQERLLYSRVKNNGRKPKHPDASFPSSAHSGNATQVPPIRRRRDTPQFPEQAATMQGCRMCWCKKGVMGSPCLWSILEKDTTTSEKSKEQPCNWQGREDSCHLRPLTRPSLDKGSTRQLGVRGQQVRAAMQVG